MVLAIKMYTDRNLLATGHYYYLLGVCNTGTLYLNYCNVVVANSDQP